MGAKITQKSFATANAAMALPVDNSGFDNHTTVESIVLDYGRNVANMIQGDGNGGVITSPSGTGTVTIPQWRNTWPLTSAAGVVTPDLQRSYTFSLTLTEDTEIQLPANITQTGIMFRIYVQQDGTGDWALTFTATGNRYKVLPDSQGLNNAAAGRSIVEVYIYSSTVLGCRIIPIYGNSQQIGISGLIPAKITVTSAQLLANGTNDLLPAPGANRFYEVVGRVFVKNGSGSNAYSAPTSCYIVSGDLKSFFAELALDFFPDDQYFTNIAVGVPQTGNICAANQKLVLSTISGSPVTSGDYDVTLYFNYRILEID
jgi:hypothetical protein